MKFAVEHKYILIAFVTAIMGASARISYENENKTTSKKKVFSYITASLFVAYLCFEVLVYWNYQKLTGLVSAVGGLISIDIIKILIEDLPNMLKKWLSNKINNDENN